MNCRLALRLFQPVTRLYRRSRAGVERLYAMTVMGPSTKLLSVGRPYRIRLGGPAINFLEPCPAQLFEGRSRGRGTPCGCPSGARNYRRANKEGTRVPLPRRVKGPPQTKL